MSGRISDRIRSNVGSVTACFIALMGTTVVATASDQGPRAKTTASATQQVKKLKRKVASVEARLAALEAKPAPASPAIPTSLPPSGPAGGELAGSYPSPTIGTVAGLDLVPSTSENDGIDFGDVELYRSGTSQLTTNALLETWSGLLVGGPLVFSPSLANLYGSAADTLRTDGNLSVTKDLSLPVTGGDLNVADGDATFGNSIDDEVTLKGYLRLPVVGAPDNSDCNSTIEVGRLLYNATANELWVCDDNATAGTTPGWHQLLAS